MDSECEMHLGPMFAGKTSAVRGKLERARLGGMKCVFVKYAGDTRYKEGPETKTHGGQDIKSVSSGGGGRLRVVEALSLLQVELGKDELYVGVDEGQFYPDLRQALDLWSREGRHVYVAALDGDYLRQPFRVVSEALPLATSVVKLRAICMMCPRSPQGRVAEASYTLRTDDSKQQVLIGAKDKYKAACLRCYLAHS